MVDEQNDFSPLLIDQQIDHPDTRLSREGAQLVHGVRAMFEQEMNAGIERGWARLRSQRVGVQQQGDVSAFIQKRDERISTMTTYPEVNPHTMPSTPLNRSPKKSARRMFSLLAAAVVCVALVGSLALALAVSRNGTSPTRVGGHGAPTVSKTVLVPSPTPTQAPPTQAAPAGLTVYHGQYYTISYPRGWVVKPLNMEVTFTDFVHGYSFSVQPIADPGFGTLSPAQIRDVVVGDIQNFKSSAKNAQDVSIAPTVVIHGVTWQQAAATGDTSVQGQQANELQGQTVNEKIVALGMDNSKQHLTYTLVFTAPTAQFAALDAEYFQPMLQSFALVP